MTYTSSQEYAKYQLAKFVERQGGLHGIAPQESVTRGLQALVGTLGSVLRRTQVLAEDYVSLEDDDVDVEEFLVGDPAEALYAEIHGGPLPAPRPSWTRIVIQSRALELVELVTCGLDFDSGEEDRELSDTVMRLAEVGDFRAARELLETARVNGRTNDEMERWSRAVSPPQLSRAPASSDRSAEPNAAWLREHAHHYSGRWVALRDGRLLGDSASRVTLHGILRERGNLRGALLVRVPA